MSDTSMLRARVWVGYSYDAYTILLGHNNNNNNNNSSYILI